MESWTLDSLSTAAEAPPEVAKDLLEGCLLNNFIAESSSI